MATRRGFLSMLGTIGLTAPAIVSAKNLMLINPKAGIILPTYKGTWTRPTVSGESFCKMFEIEMDHMDSILYKLEIGRIERFRFISSPYLEHVHES